MSAKNYHIIVAFDVDGTLIDIKNDTPRYEIIQLLHSFQKLGCRVYVWSGGGVDYAARWCERLGITGIAVVAKGTDIDADITFDDMDLDFRNTERSLGKVNIQV